MSDLYLIDANVLIRAHGDYYPIDRVPQFWDWLLKVGRDGVAKMPFQIHDEIGRGTDLLADWINDKAVSEALILQEQPDRALVQHVISKGYASDLKDHELEKVGRDPFLVAYGLVHAERQVITKENRKPTSTRGNRKIPDVCESVGVPWSNDFAFFRKLGFTTK